MEIIHLIKTTTGATWALKQIKELINLGCNVHVILPNNNNLYQKYIDIGAKVYVLNVDIAQSKNLIKLIKSIYTFRQLMNDIKPDLIHSHFVGTTLFMRLALIGMKVKRIFQVPGPLHLEKTLTRLAEISSANQYDYWIPTCSLSKKIYLEHGVDDSKLMLTFYGTETSVYQSKSQGTLRQEFSIPEHIKIVGMVAYTYAPKKWLGQKRGLKGHEDLIDAMEIVAQSHPNVICVVVGGAWEGADDYYQSVKDYGKAKLGDKILFLGTRNDVPKLYPDFDVVVHPSHSENLGGAAESLLMSVPTIATNIGGFPDIVKPNETGWLVPKENPIDLSDAILEALTNPKLAHELAQEGATRLKVSMDVKNTSKDVYDFYKKTLES